MSVQYWDYETMGLNGITLSKQPAKFMVLFISQEPVTF
jgi:hypothetical protein